ncbi:Imm26 family immunity protein [Paenibacillus sp. FSL E2-0151]|uniref:Imm26 family immunity protein n=1 Tax=Paenibacillus sp. FSL E2-0151 TaxID=2921357 RepID=UPI0030EF6E22
MKNTRRKRIKLGDIYAIPLPNGKFSFGRRLKDASIAIYNVISDTIEEIPQEEEYQFIVGVYDDVLKSGDWSVVENRPFPDEEEAWPPPACIIDKISGEYLIYHMGEIRPSNSEESEGLEIAAVWEAHHIVDRIMGDDKWHRDPNK